MRGMKYLTGTFETFQGEGRGVVVKGSRKRGKFDAFMLTGVGWGLFCGYLERVQKRKKLNIRL